MTDDARYPSRRLWLAAGLVFLGLAAVALILLLLDPFGWNLLDKASGLRDESAAAMPPDVTLYAEIDLINFSEEALTDFSQPFVAALDEPGVDDLGSGLERLDALLQEQVGLTLRDDVLPWLGRSVGLGLTDLALLPDGRIDRVGWLLVASTQDRRAADDFLDSLGARIAATGGATPQQTDYRGRTITSFEPAPSVPLGGLAFTRSAGQVILGADASAVRSAVDAQQGQSLAGNEQFKMLTESLPAGRGLTLYADQSQLPELGRLLADVAPLAVGPLDLTNLILPPGAIGVSIVDQGLRLDTATPDDGQKQPSAGQALLAEALPAETLAFLAGDGLDATWSSLKRSLEAGGSLSDFEESMALLSREFGYDPDQQLVPLLDSPWALAILPADVGLVDELTGLPLGLVLLAGGGDTAALETAVDQLNQSLEGQRLPLETVEVGGAAATTVDLSSLIGAPLPLYGIDGDRLFLATDAPNLARVLEPGDDLSQESRYTSAAAMLPEDHQAALFLDLSRLLAHLGDVASDQPARLLSPVEYVIAGAGPSSGGVRQGIIFVAVNKSP